MNEKDLFTALRARKMPNGQRTWRCPDEAQLAAYADAQLEGQNRQRVEAHLADCDFCLSQVAFLLRLQGAEMPGEVPETLLARANALAGAEAAVPRVVFGWGAVAVATACLALAVTVWLRHPATVIAPSQPSATPPAVITAPPAPAVVPPSLISPTVRSGPKKISLPELLVPREGSVIARGDVALRWKAVPRTLFYEIRIVTAEGDLIWEARAESTNARLPRDVQLVAGQKYFVWVRAYLPEGKTVQSKAVAFRAASNS